MATRPTIHHVRNVIFMAFGRDSRHGFRVCRRLASLVFLLACGGRTSLDDADPLSDGGGGGGVDVAARSSAYKIVYTVWEKGISEWHSANGSVDALTADNGQGVSCSYDGRYIARDRHDYASFDVLDASGAIVRTQQGLIGPIRPDGARVIAARPVANTPNQFCEGTLDVDGTFANVRCFSTVTGESFGAEAYAPDGKTVLWSHNFYDAVTTGTIQSIETALEDGSNPRVIVPVATKPYGYRFLTSASFSFDGSLVTYGDCTETYGSARCEVKIVRIDTLDTTVVAKGGLVAAPHFVPDGSGIVYLESPYADVGKYSIRRVDLATGSISTLVTDVFPVYDGPDLCVALDD